MKVDIKTEEGQEGLVFKKKYQVVTLQVEFSEEETAIIKQNKLDDVVVLERGLPANRKPENWMDEDSFNLKVWSLRQKDADTFAFDSIGGAKQYISKLKEQLPHVKAMLEGNVGEAEDESFEL